MKMMQNGNYDLVISSIQHECSSKDFTWRSIEYGWQPGRLRLQIESGDPYEDGFSSEIDISYCPFCGYKSIENK